MTMMMMMMIIIDLLLLSFKKSGKCRGLDIDTIHKYLQSDCLNAMSITLFNKLTYEAYIMNNKRLSIIGLFMMPSTKSTSI